MPIAQVSLWMDPFKFSHQEKNERPTVAKLRFCNGVKKTKWVLYWRTLPLLVKRENWSKI